MRRCPRRARAVRGVPVRQGPGRDARLRFGVIGQRESVFDGLPWSVYAPPHHRVTVTAESDCEIALCSAPATGKLPPGSSRPGTSRRPTRGKGANLRHVRNILAEKDTAESLLVVEVITPGRPLVELPPAQARHRRLPRKSFLEETYYHRINPPQGFAFLQPDARRRSSARGRTSCAGKRSTRGRTSRSASRTSSRIRSPRYASPPSECSSDGGADPALAAPIIEGSMLAIVKEVEGMDALLADFRAFASLPEPQRDWTELSGLVADSVALYAASYPEVRFRFERTAGGADPARRSRDDEEGPGQPNSQLDRRDGGPRRDRDRGRPC